MENKKIRVRYAPSPTGHLHIGGARTALFNYLFAKHNKGDFIVRIEDTDIERNIENGEKSQLDNLEWLGIIPDESPMRPNKKYGSYRQMERLDIYKKYADILLEKGFSYKCYCTSEELESEREEQKKKGIMSYRYSRKCLNKKEQNKPYSIRFKLPENKDISWEDMVRENVVVNTTDIGDFVIVKSSGIPTYNFAVVIDDIQMEISHVLRGEEHISNTPKQLVIYEALKEQPPLFGHMTLITNEEGKKLSKRDETIMQFISQYKESGYLPKAMFNFMSLLGWSPEGEEEIFTKEKLIEIFNYKRWSKSSSIFNKDKLIWINNRYIKEMSEKEYLDLVIPFIEKTYEKNKLNNDIALLYKSQLSYAEQIVKLVSLFFKQNFNIDQASKQFLKENDSNDIKKELVSLFKKITNWDIEEIGDAIKKVGSITNKKGKLLFMPIRIFTTGQMHGPDLKSSIKFLGKDKVIKNIGG